MSTAEERLWAELLREAADKYPGWDISGHTHYSIGALTALAVMAASGDEFGVKEIKRLAGIKE